MGDCQWDRLRQSRREVAWHTVFDLILEKKELMVTAARVQLSGPGVGNYSSALTTIRDRPNSIPKETLLCEVGRGQFIRFCEAREDEERTTEGGLEQERRSVAFGSGLWRGTGFAGDERLNRPGSNELKHGWGLGRKTRSRQR